MTRSTGGSPLGTSRSNENDVTRIRATTSVFWPAITAQIAAMREKCGPCNATAPSQPSAPPTPCIEPEYPFQCLCSDYFTYKGKNYVIIVDRYSNWPIVNRAENQAEGLVKILRSTFCTYGIAYELASDGRPQYTANVTRDLLRNWGVHHRLPSVAFPHSNTRAELGVKMCKHLLMENTGPNGELDTDKFQHVMLNYRNTPCPQPWPSSAGRSTTSSRCYWQNTDLTTHGGRHLPIEKKHSEIVTTMNARD